MNQSRTLSDAPLAAAPSSLRSPACNLGGTAAPLRRLVSGRCGLRLQVLSGTIWLTQDARARTAGGLPNTGQATERDRDATSAAAFDLAARDGRDVWLRAGDSIDLPAGSSWLVQGWPEARITFEALALAPGHRVLRQAVAWWRGLGGALSRRSRSTGHGAGRAAAASTACTPPA
ncbi:MAG: hypothetical protein RIQ60_3930 [Pseudomonadota bacterium]